MTRTRPVGAPTLSLFPFLAVLLCMMGALLVLLVIFSSSAKQGETAEAIAARQQLEDMLQSEKESLAWRAWRARPQSLSDVFGGLCQGV